MNLRASGATSLFQKEMVHDGNIAFSPVTFPFYIVPPNLTPLDGRYSGLASGYSEIQSVSRSFLNTEKYRAEIQGLSECIAMRRWLCMLSFRMLGLDLMLSPGMMTLTLTQMRVMRLMRP